MSGRGSTPACMKVFSLWSASPIGPGGADLLEVHQDICPTWRRLVLEIQPEINSSKHRQGKYIGERKLHDTVHACRLPHPPLHRRNRFYPPSLRMICFANCSLISLCRGTGCDVFNAGFVYQSCLPPCLVSTQPSSDNFLIKSTLFIRREQAHRPS
jgi:hypothetical protein